MGKYTTEKVDIEKMEDKPVFEKMSECLKELMKLIDPLTDEDLEQGYYVAMYNDIPPKIDSHVFYLKFKRRKKK
jgi:hypothetical protein